MEIDFGEVDDISAYLCLTDGIVICLNGRDVKITSSDSDGLAYQAFDEDTGEGIGDVKETKWEEVKSIHVY